MAVFILEDALSGWTNLGKHLLFVWLFVFSLSIKTGTRRIIRLDELELLSIARRSRRMTEDSSSRWKIGPVLVFILETKSQTNNKCLPKFVQTDNASSSIKKATIEYLLRLALWASAHAHLITDHFHDATRHSVLEPSCELPLRFSVCRLPKSATSQSIWVLSCTVKLPGLAHDRGRDYGEEKQRELKAVKNKRTYNKIFQASSLGTLRFSTPALFKSSFFTGP